MAHGMTYNIPRTLLHGVSQLCFQQQIFLGNQPCLHAMIFQYYMDRLCLHYEFINQKYQCKQAVGCELCQDDSND